MVHTVTYPGSQNRFLQSGGGNGRGGDQQLTSPHN